MKAIEVMVKEHENIKKMLMIVSKICIKIVNGENISYENFDKVIDFIRNYADKHHHNKEEDILFKKMTDNLGDPVANGPIYGMLAEHDLGRLYINNLEVALERVKKGDMDSRVDIIGNAMAYVDLLTRHIDKEDHAIYKFALRKLSKEDLEIVEKACEEIEKNAMKKNIQDKYIELINELEKI